MSYTSKLSANLKKSGPMTKARAAVDSKVGKVTKAVKTTEKKFSNLIKSKKA